MPTLHDMLTASTDERAARYAADRKEPSRATVARIRPVRRRRALTTRAICAVAGGGLLVAGVLQGDVLGLTDDGQTAQAEPAVTEVVIDATRLPGPPSLPRIARGDSCGESIEDLAAQSHLEGFAVEARLRDGNTVSAPTEFPEVVSTVTYDGEPHAPVFLDHGRIVLAQDGVIVAWVYAWRPNPDFVRLDTGSEWTTETTLRNDFYINVIPCAPSAFDTWPFLEELPSGKYELYVIATMKTNRTLVAQQVLAEEFFIVGPDHAGTWVPGSDDCSLEARFAATGARVLQCQPTALPHVSVDLDQQTVTVPVPSALYQSEVYARAISQPLPVTYVAPEWNQFLTGTPGDTQDLTFGTRVADLSCASRDFAWISGDGHVGARVIDSTAVEDVVAHTAVRADIDPHMRFGRGTLDLQPSGHAWVISETPDYWWKVVGTAPVTFSRTSGIPIHGGLAASDVRIDVGDIEWCGEPVETMAALLVPGTMSVTTWFGLDGMEFPATSRYDSLLIEVVPY